MITKYILNRGCLRWSRPRLINFLVSVFYPNMAVADTAAIYTLADGKITVVKDKISDYARDHGLHHTVAANTDWEGTGGVQESLGLVFDYLDETADNDPVKLELTGMPIAIPAGHGTPDPRTGRVTNVVVIAEGGLLYRAEYEADEYAHHFRGRTRIYNQTPPAPWTEEGESQNHTMYFIGKQYPRGTEVEVEIMASGTKGEAVDFSLPASEIIK